MARENGLFGWNLFGNQTPLGPRPDYQEYADKDGDPLMSDKEEAEWKMAMDQWEERKSLLATREATYQKMAQNVGDTPPAFTTSMPKREAPEFVAAGRGPVDILAPEVETIDDLYRKRPNMFRMI